MNEEIGNSAVSLLGMYVLNFRYSVGRTPASVLVCLQIFLKRHIQIVHGLVSLCRFGKSGAIGEYAHSRYAGRPNHSAETLRTHSLVAPTLYERSLIAHFIGKNKRQK
jgi:hypothetical protein